MLACSCITTPSNNTVDFKETVAPVKPHSVQVWDLLESVSGLHCKGEQTKRSYSQKYLMNFGIYFEKSHAPTRGHQFNKSLRSVTGLERRESLHWLHPDSRPPPVSGEPPLSAGPFSPAGCWEGLSVVSGVYTGKWVMVMDFVMAARLESLTPNNDPKYWDFFVILCFFIPPRMSYVKPLIQSEEPFQKQTPFPDPQMGSVWLFLCFSCLRISVCICPFYTTNLIANYSIGLLERNKCWESFLRPIICEIVSENHKNHRRKSSSAFDHLIPPLADADISSRTVYSLALCPA